MPVIIPYNSYMPGITNFTFNTINRNSASIEPGQTVVTTGLSTTVIRGQSYTISITHTVDSAVCLNNNLRVWIDYDQDLQLDGPGETVLSADYQFTATPYSTTITIPMTALTGSTRLRVTAKMPACGGHIFPSPCNIPADPAGYHGEMEDYTVTITDPTGMEEFPPELDNFSAFSNLQSSGIAIVYVLNKPSDISIAAYNITGQKINQPVYNRHQPAGRYEMGISNEFLYPGLYFIRMTINGKGLSKKVAFND